jgi:hypothetical protein
MHGDNVINSAHREKYHEGHVSDVPHRKQLFIGPELGDPLQAAKVATDGAFYLRRSNLVRRVSAKQAR